MSDEKPMIFRAVEEFQAMATEVVALRAHAARLEGEVERLTRERDDLFARLQRVTAERQEAWDNNAFGADQLAATKANVEKLLRCLNDANDCYAKEYQRAARLEERLGVVRGVLKEIVDLDSDNVDASDMMVACARRALLAALGEGE